MIARFKPPDTKKPQPVRAWGLLNSCDAEDMPVICPTCQNFSGAQKTS
jgi:hypothetical protein